MTGKRAAFGLLALCVMGLVTWMSARDTLRIGPRDVMPGGWVGNLLHVVTFAVLGFALVRAFDAGARPLGLATRHGVAAFVVASLFGVCDEIHQYFSPGRLSSLYDALLDAAGAAAALLVPMRRDLGRPDRWWPSVTCFAVAFAVAVVTGKTRLPGDGAIVAVLGALGYVRA